MEGRTGDLVGRVRAGDVAAFEVLYRSHVDAVSAVVRGMVRDGHLVPDLVQETFVRAMEGLDSLQEADRFKPWLLAIARNVSVDQVSRGAASAEVTVWNVGDREDVQETPERSAEIGELLGLVRDCLAGLSKREAVAVWMVGYMGFAPGDVASALGVSKGNAKVIAHRARRRLRNAVMLESLVRLRGSGCPAFAAALEQGAVAAGRHLRECARCRQEAEAEVQLYHVASREDVLNGGIPADTGL